MEIIKNIKYIYIYIYIFFFNNMKFPAATCVFHLSNGCSDSVSLPDPCRGEEETAVKNIWKKPHRLVVKSQKFIIILSETDIRCVSQLFNRNL